jgi:hypothetical protein
MPQRSLVSQLPEAIKADLDRRLLDSGFSGYVALSEWLSDQGYEIKKSALQNYGSQFEARLFALKLATEQAKAITEAVGDDENAMGDALSRIAQQKAFEVLVDFEMADGDKVNLPAMLKAVADLNKSSVTVKKYQAEVQARVQAAAVSVREQAQKGGLSEEAIRAIESQVLGIA